MAIGRKWLMRQYWRLQQSQTLISMGFWCTTLTLLIWPYVRWRFDSDEVKFGLPMTYWGLLSIAFGVLFVVLSIGYIYDQFLSLWKEQRTVDTERNPFGTYALIPANVIILGQLNELLKRTAADDKEVQNTCNWIDEWLAWCSSQEIWARSQRFWDEELPVPVPPLSFLPEGTVEAARGAAAELDD